MINSDVQKEPLPLDQYEKYEIPQDYMAYVVEFNNIDQITCDNLEADYYTQRYKIFHTELKRARGDLFNYKLIIAKAGFTF